MYENAVKIGCDRAMHGWWPVCNGLIFDDLNAVWLGDQDSNLD